MAEEKKLMKVTIENITIEVEAGTSILQAARKIGGDVVPPAMCFYTKLKGSGGKCRTCLVRVAAGSTADPRPMPKLVASCRTNVMDGMIVESITNPAVLTRSIALCVTRPVNVTCRILATNMAAKAHVTNSNAEHSNVTISALTSSCT
jgi:NADH-quinone oxidoreductase subunit G